VTNEVEADVGYSAGVARRLDDLRGLPLNPIDDGLSEAERLEAWAAWNAEWDELPVIEMDVTAAETLAEARVAGEV
jgi:hypothetical protein